MKFINGMISGYTDNAPADYHSKTVDAGHDFIKTQQQCAYRARKCNLGWHTYGDAGGCQPLGKVKWKCIKDGAGEIGADCGTFPGMTVKDATFQGDHKLSCVYSGEPTNPFDTAGLELWFEQTVIDKMQSNYCQKTNTLNVDNTHCKSILGNNYYKTKIESCVNAGFVANSANKIYKQGWPKEASCITAINDAIRLNDTSASTAKSAAHDYCSTAAGRIDQVCACFNVSDTSLNCEDAKYNCEGSSGSTQCPTGCTDYIKLKKSLNEIGAPAALLSSVTSDALCYQPACLGNNSTTTIIPDSSQTHICPTSIQACINTFSNNNYSNSTVSVSCQNTLGITNSPGSGGSDVHSGGTDTGSGTKLPPDVPQSTPPPKETTNISLIVFIILAILSAIGIVVSFYL
jgi:hypothetical protein